MLRMKQKKPLQKKQAKANMILKKTTRPFLLFFILTLGSIKCSYGKHAAYETDVFIKECINYYRILRDKSLRYFANHPYTDIFFKTQNNVINRKSLTYERKSYDYQK